VSRAPNHHDFAPKKRPTQSRSQATFDALVDATTLLLPKLGYAGTTTNHIAARAGVNIASLYEYFPGKDAIVAQVAERLVERVMGRLEAGALRVLEKGGREAVRLWIELIHETVAREKDLVAVFLYQVPYASQLESLRDITERLIEFSEEIRKRAGGTIRAELSGPSLMLLINLVSSTIMQIVHELPKGVTRAEMLDELVRRVEGWVAR